MAKTKVIVVGASHGGHQSILELLHRYDNLDITMFEAGDFVSFMSCGMELFLENSVTNVSDVRNFEPKLFTDQGVHVLNNHEVTKINADAKTVTVKDTKSGDTSDYSYDKLILSSGVTPNSIPVPGADLDNVFLMRGYDWATSIKAKLEDPSVKNITVIGAGYIGIEAAEASRKAGKNVTLIDMIDRPLGLYLDEDMTNILTKHLEDNGVKLVMSAQIKSYEGTNGKVTSVKTADGEYDSDLVIQAAGVKPNTKWLQGTVDLDDHGFIKNDEYLRTNLPDVYALGDATLAYSVPAQGRMPIALATVARREARYVTEHIFEKQPSVPFKGVVGSSALSVFDYHFAASGLNTTTAKRAGVKVDTTFYQDTLRPSYVPTNKNNPDVYASLVFDPQTHKILGGAVLSTYDISAQGNVIALAVQNGLRLEDLAEADFFFQPGFDRQWSLLNLTAQHALGDAQF
ncbi:FAD-dependent oxidoreductase [Paucilactobacillus suebicus]|uniref:NAD(FAD)-dependent dehydrogenase n=1 Tax=Paucilactobacillus suebicus DSM 5007 = KCTC 3549 TaxID=1423807 RepID=A0A0R1W8V6_9LACO|nr:FAD-dependent oxidoreductase [Paucilactobacillus suebicus]KRM12299.1 NAD(FAD)-dependent dehydrogenase [Paucilactobacillus suebicus DSM 5007 = KCTC 3549]